MLTAQRLPPSPRWQSSWFYPSSLWTVCAHSCVGPISEHQLYLPLLPGPSWTRVEERRWLMALFWYSTGSFLGCVCGFCIRVSASWKLHRSRLPALLAALSRDGPRGCTASHQFSGLSGLPWCMFGRYSHWKKKKTPAGSDPLFPKILEVLSKAMVTIQGYLGSE